LRILSNFSAYYLKKTITLSGYIVSVPPKPKYGYNSVDIIAQEFSKIFKLKLLDNFIIRSNNEQKIFYFNQNIKEKIMIDESIIIVDDIFTSGETFENIYYVLESNNFVTKNLTWITLGRTLYGDELREYSNLFLSTKIS